jgi:hypothetical protein
MKKYIQNIVALLFLLQGIYVVYRFALIFMRFINTFDYSAYEIYAYTAFIGTAVLFICAGIGLFSGKRWSIILAWVAVLLPQILKLIEPRSNIPLEYNYIILVINTLIMIYLSVQWKKIV